MIDTTNAVTTEPEWQPITTAPCDDRYAKVRWQDGTETVEDLDHDSDPEWWAGRGATHWHAVTDAEVKNFFQIKSQSPKHLISRQRAKHGSAALIARMDGLAANGWQPFQVLEIMINGDSYYVILSRKSSDDGDAGQRIAAALDIALQYGMMDGEGHKAWVIDQMVRRLAGASYLDLVKDQWNQGTAPPDQQ